MTFRLRDLRRHPESDLQRAVIQYWALQYPTTWALTMHTPSGVAIDAKRAAVFKSLGWKRGIPDLLCFARRGKYTGLALELKATATAHPSVDQQQWLDGLEDEGWCVGVFSELPIIGAFIDTYHALPTPKP